VTISTAQHKVKGAVFGENFALWRGSFVPCIGPGQLISTHFDRPSERGKRPRLRARAGKSRCVSILTIAAGSSRAAMIFKSPPHCGQCPTSMSKTRPSATRQEDLFCGLNLNQPAPMKPGALQHAFMIGGEMLHDDKSHATATAVRDCRKEFFECGQATGRGANADDGKAGCGRRIRLLRHYGGSHRLHRCRFRRGFFRGGFFGCS